MVTGGLAAILYGEPRLTNDVDVVADLVHGSAESIVSAFPQSAYYVPPLEVMQEEAARSAHGHFNLLHLESAMRADVYVMGGDPLAAWAMERRRQVPIGGDSIWLAPIEYVILMKLEYHRQSGSDRHMRDIDAMLRLSGHLVDRGALSDWITRLGLDQEWERTQPPFAE